MKALLVIDVVNMCCSKDSEYDETTFTKIREMVPRLESFIGEWRKRSLGPVIFVRCTPWNKEHLKPNLVELYKNPDCNYYSDDTEGKDNLFFKVKPEKEDLIITKNTYDAFSGKDLDEFLKEKGIGHLAITGVFSDGCVEATIQNAFSRGYHLTMLKDLIETTDEPHRQSLQHSLKDWLWPTAFGPTLTSEEFLKSA